MLSMNRAYGHSKAEELSNEKIMKFAPSVFAEVAHERTSARYTQIPTIRVVDALRREGWAPVLAKETKVRDASRKGYARHLLRFRHMNDIQRVAVKNETVHEIVLLNSHDGTSSYQLHAGLFRFVCANGMVVADTTFEKRCVRHSGDIVSNVIDGVFEIVHELPTVTEQIERFREITLNSAEQEIFGKAAIALRWDAEEKVPPVQPAQVVQSRRAEDRNDDIWTVLNRAQENILKGGMQGFTHDQKGRVKRTATREVKSVSENVRLNKALWTLADEMAKLKTS